MFCGHCGFEIHKSANTCWNCRRAPRVEELRASLNFRHARRPATPTTFCRITTAVRSYPSTHRGPVVIVLAVLVFIVALLWSDLSARSALPAKATAPPSSPTSTLERIQSAARPQNAAVMLTAGPRGRGQLRLRNSAAADAIVKLVSLDQVPIREVYVRAAQDALLRGIPDGSYLVRFCEVPESADSDELVLMGAITRCFRFDRAIEFHTNSTPDKVVWNNFDVTLYAVPLGNVRILPINPREF